MSVKVPITVEGNLGADPKYGEKDGRPYAQLLVIQNDRRLNDETKEWEDAGPPIFHNAVVFGQQAKHVAESLKSGMGVIVTGDLRFRSFEVEGKRRQGTEIEASAVGPSLKFATAVVHTASRGPAPEVSQEPWVTPSTSAAATGPVAVAETGWPTTAVPR
jgi:single-strand DNA-binding protein